MRCWPRWADASRSPAVSGTSIRHTGRGLRQSSTKASAGPIQWKPTRSQKDLFNRISGTYTAPNLPWNIAGNLYDANGFYDGNIQNNFPYAYQPRTIRPTRPIRSMALQTMISGRRFRLIGAYSSGTTYGLGDVVSVGTGTALVMYKSLVASNVGHAPATSPTAWVPYSNLLQGQLMLLAVCSVTQAQRLARSSCCATASRARETSRRSRPCLPCKCCDVDADDVAKDGLGGEDAGD